jgi:hypothetical protein
MTLAALFFGGFRTENLSCGEKQDGTEKGNQHPNWVGLWNDRNGRVFSVLLTGVLAAVARTGIAEAS